MKMEVIPRAIDKKLLVNNKMDKVTYGTALKTIVSDVFEEGEEPFAESNPNDYFDAIFPPCSLVGRIQLSSPFTKQLVNDNTVNCWKILRAL